MKYILKPGSIAAVMYVDCEDGARWTLVYMGQGKPIDASSHSPQRGSLPVEPLHAAAEHYKAMFALPVEQRQALIDATAPVEFEVEGA